MKKSLFLLAFLIKLGMMMQAQAPSYRHAFTADLSALWRHGWGSGYALRLNDATALEFSFTRQDHPITLPNVFEGDYVTHYIMRTEQAHSYYYNEPIGQSIHAYVGENRPLPALPSEVPLSTWQSRIGIRCYIGDKKRFRFFSQPGLSLTRHSFLHIEQNTAIEREVKDYHLLPRQSGEPYIYTQQTTFYRQVQAMRRQNFLLYGLAYDAGVQLTRGRLLLEAMLNSGVHFSTPYKKNAPKLARNFYGRFLLRAGFAFGGKK